jgi:hypothetical protein
MVAILGGELMNLLTMVRDTLGRLQSGAVMAEIFSVTARLAGVGFALMAIVFWFETWKTVSDLEGGAMLGGLVAQLLVLAGCGITTMVFWVRGEDIRQSAVPDFSVLPAGVVFLRMLGEVYAVMMTTVVLALAVMRLFDTGGVSMIQLYDAFPILAKGLETFGSIAFSPSDSGFLSAAKLMLGGLVGSVFWLALFYGLAESLNLSLTIAKSTRSTYEILHQRLR